MNTFEYLLENNPLRGYVREMMEVKPLRAATDIGTISRALHIACGNGEATRLLVKHFAPERLSGVDRDGAAVAAARANHGSETADFSVQAVTSLDFDDGSFDAVFDLADLHNYPDWKRGVTELQRVLKPGGHLILEEISLESFTFAAGKMFRALTEHPYDSMLTIAGLRDYALQSGFEILSFQEKVPFGLFKYFIMIARKA